MTFTKEQLIARAETVLSNARTAADFHDSKPYHLMDIHLAEIALASLEAEPVAYMVRHHHEAQGTGTKIDATDLEYYKSRGDYHYTPLYTAPPAPVAVPDFGALTKCIVQRLVDYGTADDEAIASAEEFVYNACRAAMLQGKELACRYHRLLFASLRSLSPSIIDTTSRHEAISSALD